MVIEEKEGKIWNIENPNMLNRNWIGLGLEEVRPRKKMAEIGRNIMVGLAPASFMHFLFFLLKK